MPSRAWTFVVDGKPHHVELEYSLWSAWERLSVDGAVLDEGQKMTFVSRYDFTIGERKCRVTLRVLTDYQAQLTVDEVPVELLSSNLLLRPASGEDDMLLRASKPSDTAGDPDALLRPRDVTP